MHFGTKSYLKSNRNHTLNKLSSVRVPQTLEPLEAYMVVNFRAREISRGTRKLTRTSMLIIKKKYNFNIKDTSFY
jgi:hypothetical protein